MVGSVVVVFEVVVSGAFSVGTKAIEVVVVAMTEDGVFERVVVCDATSVLFVNTVVPGAFVVDTRAIEVVVVANVVVVVDVEVVVVANIVVVVDVEGVDVVVVVGIGNKLASP